MTLSITIQPNGTIQTVTGTVTTAPETMLTYSLTIQVNGTIVTGTVLETTLTTSSTMEVNKQILMVTDTETIQTEQMVTNMQTIHYVGLTEMVMDTVTRKVMTHSH